MISAETNKIRVTTHCHLCIYVLCTTSSSVYLSTKNDTSYNSGTKAFLFRQNFSGLSGYQDNSGNNIQMGVATHQRLCTGKYVSTKIENSGQKTVGNHRPDTTCEYLFICRVNIRKMATLFPWQLQKQISESRNTLSSVYVCINQNYDSLQKSYSYPEVQSTQKYRR